VARFMQCRREQFRGGERQGRVHEKRATAHPALL
jgi:hypothetical protein